MAITVQSQPYLNYCLLGNFCVALFSRISQNKFCSVVKLLKSPFSQKFSDEKFPGIRYLPGSVKSLNYIQHVIIGCNH